MSTRHKLPAAPRCPGCKAELDGATNMDNTVARPKAGDVSVCAYCGEIIEFMDELKLRSASPEVLKELHPVDRKMLQRMSQEVQRLNNDATRH